MLLADTVIPIYTSTCIFQPFYSPFTKAQLSRNEERPALARCHCSSTPQESRNPRTRSDAYNDSTAGSTGQRVSVSVRSGLHRAVPFLCLSDSPYTHAVPSLCVRPIHLTPYSPVSVCPSDPPHTVQSRLCVSVRSTSHRTVPSLCVRQIHLTPYSPVSVCPSDPPHTVTVPLIIWPAAGRSTQQV